MIIDQIEMENFGPYRGKHTLRLGLGDHPLVVIHGQNMAGKTTIINAVRWGLYGIAKDRRGKPLPTRALINDEAFGEGNRFVSVSLTLRVPEEDDATYVLRRQHQAKSAHSNSRVDSDYEEIRDFTRDGVVESPAFFDEAVASILPEGISRFFLFDGELLNEYEELVREGGQREAQAVKQAIELILGLPAARQGRDDVRVLQEEVRRRLRRAAAEDQRARDAGQKLEDLAADKLRLESDQDTLEGQLSDARSELRKLDENLKNFEESRADAGRKEALVNARADLAARQKTALETRRELVKDLWRDILAPRLEREMTRLDEERARREEAIARTQAAHRALRKLHDSLEEGVCDQCGQRLPDEGRARARAEMADLQQTLDELEPHADMERTRELTRIIGQLRKVAPAGKVDAVKLAEDELGRIRMEGFRNRQELERVEERLGNIDTAQMAEYDRDRRRYDRLAAEVTQKLETIIGRLAEVETETQRQQAIVLQNENPRFKRLSRELETLEALEEVYSRAVDVLAAELRAAVERKASEIFLQLTTDESYGGLSINENYGLTILRRDATPAEQRSAGAEQVVALSLLGALNRLATKRGPVIMDTPFGRLDRDHRANILRYLPTMADQVVLLVHDGEVDRDRDLAEIRGQIDAEYRIDHPTSSSSNLVQETLAGA